VSTPPAQGCRDRSHGGPLTDCPPTSGFRTSAVSEDPVSRRQRLRAGLAGEAAGAAGEAREQRSSYGAPGALALRARPSGAAASASQTHPPPVGATELGPSPSVPSQNLRFQAGRREDCRRACTPRLRNPLANRENAGCRNAPTSVRWNSIRRAADASRDISSGRRWRTGFVTGGENQLAPQKSAR
jgi:hypothetical protein